MASLTIISGCPGSGKTTLSKQLANNSSMGVRVDTDAFYHFVAHRLDPSTPESKMQNTTVVRAFLRAANTYFQDGHDVFIDGVIGPWWLELIQDELTTFEYAILHADLETVQRRTSERAKTSQVSANPTLVEIMHSQFDAIAGMARRTISTSGKIPSDVLDEFTNRQREGDFD
jgi:cytidylate kinase